MATHGSPDECGICNNEFDEADRYPRIFNCFHTVCNRCVAELIRNKRKRCPYCRTIFHAYSSEDVKKNQDLLELIRYYSGSKSKRLKRSEVTSQQKIITGLKEEALENSLGQGHSVQDAYKQIEHVTKEVELLKKIIIHENQRIENYVLPKVLSVISQNKRAVGELSDVLKILHCQLQALEGQNITLEDTGSLQATSAVVDEAGEMTRGVRGWIKNIQRARQEMQMELENVKDDINIILDELNPRQERYVPVPPSLPETTIDNKNTSVNLISIEAFQEMNKSLKHMVEGGNVFAVWQYEERKAYAKLSITEDDKLCLHYLTQRQLPPDSYVVEYQDLLKLVNPSSRLTFLELSTESSTLGRLYIELFSDSAEARNFTVLCTGELGECYVDTHILEVNSKGSRCECVGFGDYEHNDGSGGRALVRGAGLWIGDYKRPWLAGTLEGLHFDGVTKASQFSINTQDNPGNDVNPCFGRVTEGLSVLTDAVTRYSNLMEVRISDCGLVLPFFPFL